MMKLRQGTIKQVIDKLDESLFTRHAFEYSFNNEESGELISVAMRDDPNSYFRVNYEEKRPENRWLVKESPGTIFMDSGAVGIAGFRGVVSRMEEWLERVLEEILLLNKGNTRSFVATLRENLELNVLELESPEAPFDQGEAQSWEQKIDHVIEQIEEMQERQELSQEAIDELKEQMTVMKENIRDIPKKVWVRSTGNRFLNFFERFTGKITESIAKGAIAGMLSSPH